MSSGVADVRALVAEAKALREAGGRTVAFIDELHRFNKSQQDALLSGAIASREFTGEEHTTLRRLVDNRRMLYELAFHRLDADLRRPFYEMQNGRLYRRYEAVEDRIVDHALRQKIGDDVADELADPQHALGRLVTGMMRT